MRGLRFLLLLRWCACWLLVSGRAVATANEFMPPVSVPPIIFDIPYMQPSSSTAATCLLDLYLPAEVKNPPLLIWLHGGSLTGGDKADAFNRKVGTGLVRLGFAVAMVNYRLSPHVTFPAYVEDAAGAVQWAVAHAASFGINPARIYLGGHSAGGYLALMAGLNAAYLPAREGEPHVLRGVISISGQTLTHATVLQERGLSTDPVRIDDAAPLRFVSARAPRLLLLCAERDVPARVEENQLLAALLRRMGNKAVAFEIIPGRDHMSIIERGIEPDDRVAQVIKAFIAE